MRVLFEADKRDQVFGEGEVGGVTLNINVCMPRIQCLCWDQAAFSVRKNAEYYAHMYYVVVQSMRMKNRPSQKRDRLSLQ